MDNNPSDSNQGGGMPTDPSQPAAPVADAPSEAPVTEAPAETPAEAPADGGMGGGQGGENPAGGVPAM